MIQRMLAKRELARRRLLHFTLETLPNYEAGWVHEDVCARLERFSQAVVDKKSPRLMLFMPPRSGKSELASIRFPAWHLGHNPEHEIMNVGYNLDLPMKFSRRVREIIRAPEYRPLFPETDLDPQSQSVEAWNTTKGGGLMAAGVGGGITGKGAHILTIDDPIKNQEEADSILVRDKIWDWYLSTAYTRLAPGGGVLIILTRWSDDDLAGRVLQAARSADGADQFEVVSYPAISTSYEYRNRTTFVVTRSEAPLDDPEQELLREPGQALHPARYDLDYLKRLKNTLQPRMWASLYQQDPVPDEGAYFTKDSLRFTPSFAVESDVRLYTAWDFAIGEKQTNDWTVGITVAQDVHDNLYVVDMVRFRGDSFVIVESMLDMMVKWGQVQDCPYLVGVEDGQIWRAVKPLLEKRMRERLLYPPIEVMKPMSDKMARARPLQGRMQQGKVLFLNDRAWVEEAVKELLRFPAGVHDDIVDAMAWVVQLSIGKAPPRVKEPPKKASWRDRLDEIVGLEGVGGHMSA